MEDCRQVKLFRNGRNQAVRIPRDYELPGDEAVLRREGNKLILEPVPPKSGLLELLATLEAIEDGWGLIEDPPARPVRF